SAKLALKIRCSSRSSNTWRPTPLRKSFCDHLFSPRRFVQVKADSHSKSLAKTSAGATAEIRSKFNLYSKARKTLSFLLRISFVSGGFREHCSRFYQSPCT